MHSSLRLYTRPGCHLCEEAEQLVTELFPNLSLELFDIDKHSEYKQKYGLRVPVLERAGGGEIGWPFGPADIRKLLSEEN